MEGMALVKPTRPKLVRWGEGCGCCTARKDVATALRRVSDRGAALLVLSPSDDLEPVVKTFTVADDRGRVLGAQAALRNLVVAIDGNPSFRRLHEQIELADVVLLIGAPEHEELVQALNPEARRVVVDRVEDVDARLLDGDGFDLAAARRRASESTLDAPGAKRSAFRAHRPFHPARLHGLLERDWPGVCRAQGVFWVASRTAHAAFLDVAGDDKATAYAGRWWAAVPPDQRPTGPAFEQHMQGWHPAFGDRVQDLLLAGRPESVDRLEEAFARCLLTDEELETPKSWGSLPHPFPWPQEAA
ncbi:MAG: hypothetical protein GY913_04285 [Proteobacteria bacterium]|nr:hypothetical protein [Pseudomonadota bacterium]